jgi:FAD/FMN-containing dehydrogenase
MAIWHDNDSRTLMPDDHSNIAPGLPALHAALGAIVGPKNVRDDAASLDLPSADIWARGAASAALVVAPGTTVELSRALAAVTEAGFNLAPRGAGMSYTGGYVPSLPNTVSLDMTRMNRVVSVRPDDMVVTVEGGCSWSALNAALAPHGLRTPFWGPMSGLVSTIGGGLSQLNAMFGAGHYGTSSESVVALTIVLSDGRILRTGAHRPDADGSGALPFFRHYGPDLAGLFCGDCGVFGVKAEITLRLMRAPAHEGYASFAFPTGESMLRALAEVARAGLASESCGFDPGLTRVRMKRASLAGDVKTLGAVAAREKSLVAGAVAAFRMVRGGRAFIPDDGYPLHLVFEGRSAAGVAQDVAEARRIALAEGGQEIEDTIARVIRAQPFPPLNSVLGPEGERWAPIHGHAALSQAPAVFTALQAVFAGLAGRFAEAGITTGYLFTHLETNAITIEPVFYWPDERFAVHAQAVEPAHMARLPTPPANPGAAALVKEARAQVQAVFTRFGCAHFQIGRTYPYRQSLDVATWALVESLKSFLDPTGAMNPGVLGLDPGHGA